MHTVDLVLYAGLVRGADSAGESRGRRLLSLGCVGGIDDGRPTVQELAGLQAADGRWHRIGSPASMPERVRAKLAGVCDPIRLLDAFRCLTMRARVHNMFGAILRGGGAPLQCPPKARPLAVAAAIHQSVAGLAKLRSPRVRLAWLNGRRLVIVQIAGAIAGAITAGAPLPAGAAAWRARLCFGWTGRWWAARARSQQVTGRMPSWRRVEMLEPAPGDRRGECPASDRNPRTVGGLRPPGPTFASSRQPGAGAAKPGADARERIAEPLFDMLAAAVLIQGPGGGELAPLFADSLLPSAQRRRSSARPGPSRSRPGPRRASSCRS